MDGPGSADGWLVSPSRATASPARQDMEMMLGMVGCCTNHPLNLTEGSSAVNIESGAFCEYFHNVCESSRQAYLSRRISTCGISVLLP